MIHAALRPLVRFFLLAALVSGLSAVLLVAESPKSAAPSLDQTEFSDSSSGARTVLHIGKTGRYSLSAESKLGTELVLVDRMAGEIGRNGTVSGLGAINGRIDRFLEPGDYQVRLNKTAGDKVKLSVQPYLMVNAIQDPSDLPLLTEHLSVSTELKDRQMMGWWVTIDAEHPVLVLELIGRNLAGATLWKDGLWETGIQPLSGVVEPETGKPMTRLEYHSQLAPGSYLVLAWGGPARAWGNESPAQPFWLRAGSIYKGEMGRFSLTIGPQGQESFQVSGRTNLVEMEASDNRRYSLGTSGFRNDQSRLSFRNSVKAG